MNVYIFGGHKTNYLTRQIHLIKKFIKDVEEIFYVQGPMVGDFNEYFIEIDDKLCQSIYITDDDVENRSRKMRHAAEYILKNYADKYCLFLHGDMFPIEEMDEKSLLDGGLAAGSSGLGMHWMLKHPDVLSNVPTECEKHEFFNKGGVSRIKDSEWFHYFGELPKKRFQIYSPGFLHVDDYFYDSQEEIEDKCKYIDAITRSLTDAYSKDPISLSGRYLKEKYIWKKAGKPTRSPEEMDRIFTICEGCPNFNRHTPDSGDCNICGCYVKRKSTKINKIFLGTSKCPDNPPRWE